MPGWLWGWFKGWLIFGGILLALGLVFGVPHILISWVTVARGGVLVCDYLGPFGIVSGASGRAVPYGCPGIAFLPLVEGWDWQGFRNWLAFDQGDWEGIGRTMRSLSEIIEPSDAAHAQILRSWGINELSWFSELIYHWHWPVTFILSLLVFGGLVAAIAGDSHEPHSSAGLVGIVGGFIAFLGISYGYINVVAMTELTTRWIDRHAALVLALVVFVCTNLVMYLLRPGLVPEAPPMAFQREQPRAARLEGFRFDPSAFVLEPERERVAARPKPKPEPAPAGTPQLPFHRAPERYSRDEGLRMIRIAGMEDAPGSSSRAALALASCCAAAMGQEKGLKFMMEAARDTSLPKTVRTLYIHAEQVGRGWFGGKTR